MKTRVLIAGAGPSGSMAAYILAKQGFYDFIIIDRTNLPRQKPCAGGIAPATVRFLRQIGLENLIAGLEPSATMQTLRLVGPDGSDNLFSSNLKARTINRKIFDTALLGIARESGAHFVPDFPVKDLITDGTGRVCGVTDGKRSIESEVVVMATGGHNKKMREKYFPDTRPLRRMVSRIGWWKNFDLPEGQLEMIFDEEIRPHYGWVFPEGDGMVNIGLCVYEDVIKNKNVADVFNGFLDKYYKERIKKAVQVGRLLSYPINTDRSVKGIAGNGMLLCGEAGRLCSPATAEGISFALESGYLAAGSIIDAYSQGPLNEKVLYGYEKKCRKAFNLRLRSSAFFSAIVKTRLFPGLIALGSNPVIKRIVNRMIPA